MGPAVTQARPYRGGFRARGPVRSWRLPRSTIWLLARAHTCGRATLGVITFVPHRQVPTMALLLREGSRAGLTRRKDLVPEAL